MNITSYVIVLVFLYVNLIIVVDYIRVDGGKVICVVTFGGCALDVVTAHTGIYNGGEI